MSTILIPGLYAMGGVLSYASLRHALVLVGRRINSIQVFFIVLPFLAAAFILVRTFSYQAASPIELVAMRRAEIALTCVTLFLFPWFIAAYTRISPRHVLFGLSAFWALLFAVNFFLPYGIQFTQLPTLSSMTLPWGERVLDLRVVHPSLWKDLETLGFFAVVAYTVYTAIRMYKKGQRNKSKVLYWGLGLLCLSVVYDLAVNNGYIVFTDMGDFGFLGFLLLIDIDSSVESRNQNQQMLTLLNHMPVSICVKNLQGQYRMVNNKFEDFFYPINTNILGKTDADLFSVEHARTFRKNELQVIEGLQDIQSELILKLNGELHILQLHQFPLLDPDRIPYALCSVFIDLTEARSRDEELNKLRVQVWHTNRTTITNVITASLAHELVQPLSAILNNAQAAQRFLAQENINLGEIHEILLDIVSDNKRAGSVINGLRALLQKNEMPRVETDLAPLIEEVVNLLHSEFIKTGTEINCVLQPDLIARVNKVQIQQVLLNLIINAIEAMAEQEHRVLRITTKLDKNTIVVSIHDSGPGIAEDMCDRIFDGFYTTKTQGLGMGLEICRSIVTSHQGAIWVAPNQGTGAIFSFTIPYLSIP